MLSVSLCTTAMSKLWDLSTNKLIYLSDWHLRSDHKLLQPMQFKKLHFY